jgi:hypothetical protein
LLLVHLYLEQQISFVHWTPLADVVFAAWYVFELVLELVEDLVVVFAFDADCFQMDFFVQMDS